jgi:hypothetical protein
MGNGMSIDMRTTCVYSTVTPPCRGDIRLHAVKAPSDDGWVGALCQKHAKHLVTVGVARIRQVETRKQGDGILREWRRQAS